MGCAIHPFFLAMDRTHGVRTRQRAKEMIGCVGFIGRFGKTPVPYEAKRSEAKSSLFPGYSHPPDGFRPRALRRLLIPGILRVPAAPAVQSLQTVLPSCPFASHCISFVNGFPMGLYQAYFFVFSAIEAVC
ncbi:MAG: hypothetical protein JRI77_02280 [Deltaproteobacteria bacterium]|nr:hypothetical protein [Deltaproteobacteria bacterium]